MKYFVLVLTVLFSVSAFALDWYDMDLDQTFTLQKDLVFEKEGITLKAGDEFALYDSITLPMNVVVYQFEVKNCPGADISTDMIIIDPTQKRNDPSVGVQLSESCSMEVFVEVKDLFTKSLFNLK